MMSVRVPRWTTSLADLALLLLGFFIMLHAFQGREQVLADATRAALDGPASSAGLALDRRAAALFEPGEARLKPAARSALVAIGGSAARRGARLRVESDGRDSAAARFDGWELAAARAAAVARALAGGGLHDDRIDILMPRGGDGGPREQRIRVRSLG